MESKAKIGKEVKSYPKIWTTYQKINEDDSLQDKELKEFYNSLLCDRKPYFFRYLYKTEAKKYSLYYNKVEFRCYSLFDMTFKELQKLENKTPEQIQFLKDAENKNGFINSDCELNRICKYIENIDFNSKQKIRDDSLFDYKAFLSTDVEFNNCIYKKFVDLIEMFNDSQKFNTNRCSNNYVFPDEFDENTLNKFDSYVDKFQNVLYEQISSNEKELVNYFIKYYYEDKKGASKNTMWKLIGDKIYNVAFNKSNKLIYIPKKNKNGDIDFLHNSFSIIKIDLKENQDDTNI